jgi:hypothetical protein
MKKSKPIIVTVTDAELKNIEAVASKLAAKGMKVDRVLPVTGVISGSCHPEKEAALKEVKGVHSVEAEAQVQLPPPDSEIQ